MLHAGLLPRSMLDPRQAPNHGYDDLWPILVALGSFPVGVVLAIVGARRSAPREDG